MSYVYGRRVTGPETDLVRELRKVRAPARPRRMDVVVRSARCSQGGTEPCLGHPLPTPLQELYTEPYEKINWYAARNNVASVDLYAPHTTVLDVLYSA